MKIKQFILLILSITLFSCVVKKVDQEIAERTEIKANLDPAKSALNFSKNVLKEKLRTRLHNRAISEYLDVQMIFETENLVSYTSYSNLLIPDNSESSNYDGFILFVATYDNSKSAEYAFQELKTNTQTRIAELEGFSGLLVEQVQVFERIRKSGGMITQKGKYVFYLVETCEEPPAEANWMDYENLFLRSITRLKEEVEILNADCEKDVFLVQKIKISW